MSKGSQKKWYIGVQNHEPRKLHIGKRLLIYRDEVRKRQKEIPNKYIALGKVGKIQALWPNSRLSQDAQTLQKHADNVNMTPIWGYAEKKLSVNKHRRCAQIQTNGTKEREQHEITQRRKEYVKEIST